MDVLTFNSIDIVYFMSLQMKFGGNTNLRVTRPIATEITIRHTAVDTFGRIYFPDSIRARADPRDHTTADIRMVTITNTMDIISPIIST